MILAEGVELFLAFVGVIYGFSLIASLIKHGFTKPENITNEKYFIGIVELSAKSNSETVVLVNLYMKELPNGRSVRQYVAMPKVGWEKPFNESIYKIELDGWVKGGTFPEKFHPVEALGDMLNRMMKAKLTGKDITINHWTAGE